MKKNIQILILSIVSIIIFSGCVTTQQKVVNGEKLIDGRPEWYYNPSKGGKVGGVGVSGIHVDGATGQKKLAVERALAEIARQMGVKVDSFSTVNSQASDSGSSVSGESHSFFTVDGSSVNAVIEKIWQDPRTKELYVWMVSK